MRDLNTGFLLSLVALFISSPSFALDSTDTLPKGIHSSSITRGIIRNIDQRYAPNGKLELLSDQRAVELSTNNLISFIDSSEDRKQLENLVAVLNSFTGGAANDLSLGYFRVDTKPEIDYWAPIYAIGLTDRTTIAIGVPVMEYRNTIRVEAFGSNVDDFVALGEIDPQIDAGLQQILETDVVQTVSNVLHDKGYKQLESTQQTFVGDLTVAVLHKLNTKSKWSMLSRSTINLPTGPKDDPHDLTDLDIFGETFVEQRLIASRRLKHGLTFNAVSGVRVNLPDQIDKRVPLSESDSLPDRDTTETLDRWIGPRLNFGGSMAYAFNEQFSIGTGFDQMIKTSDQFSGSRGARYDLVERDTDMQATTMRLGASYNAIPAFQNNQVSLPFVASYRYSDVISGRNIQRQTAHELWFSLFF